MAEVDRITGLVGYSGMKVPVLVASTAAIVLSGNQTIDGIACVTGDRVLLKDQASAIDNGIWVCDTGAWSRAKDCDGSYDLVSGSLVPVFTGTANAGKVFRCTTSGAIVIGTTALTFTQALFSSLSGASFLQAGTGAVTRGAQDKMRDIVNAADFGFAATATAAVNAAAINLAIATFPAGLGGLIYLDAGNFAVAADTIAPTKPHITIQGAGSGFSVTSSLKGGTNITFGAGTIGFDLTQSALGRNYSCLRDMNINGGAVCANGIKVLGTAILEYLECNGFTTAGIWLSSLINQTALRHVSSSYNLTGYGLLVGSGGVTTNTLFSCDNCDFLANLVGVRIENAYFAEFSNCVIEANTQDGLSIYKPNGVVVTGLAFRNCWLEGNNVSAGAYAGLRIDSQTHSATADTSPHHIVFDSCEISEPVTAMILTAAQFVRFLNCNTDGAITLGADCYDSGFVDRHITTAAVITDTGARNYDLTSSLIGKYLESVTGATNYPTTAQWGDLTSITLTPGDWDVTASMYADAAAAPWSESRIGISSTSGNSATGLTLGSNYILQAWTASATVPSRISMAIPNFRVVVTANTVYYFKFFSTYGAGQPQATGRLSARKWK